MRITNASVCLRLHRFVCYWNICSSLRILGIFPIFMANNSIFEWIFKRNQTRYGSFLGSKRVAGKWNARYECHTWGKMWTQHWKYFHSSNWTLTVRSNTPLTCICVCIAYNLSNGCFSFLRISKQHNTKQMTIQIPLFGIITTAFNFILFFKW